MFAYLGVELFSVEKQPVHVEHDVAHGPVLRRRHLSNVKQNVTPTNHITLWENHKLGVYFSQVNGMTSSATMEDASFIAPWSSS